MNETTTGAAPAGQSMHRAILQKPHHRHSCRDLYRNALRIERGIRNAKKNNRPN